MKLRRAVVGVLCVVLAATASSGQRREVLGPYEVVHGWPQMPDGRMLGQATGVDLDSRGLVYVSSLGPPVVECALTPLHYG
jgi:hypothetical protein